MGMSTFNIDELNKAMALIAPKVWESKDLDDFMKNNSNIGKVMMVTPLEEMKDVEWIPTKYGNLKVKYSQYIPPDQMFFVRVPDDFTETKSIIDPIKE